MLRIAVLASGSGSNAEELHRYFSDSDLARVELIVTNNTKAGVIDRFSGKKCRFAPLIQALKVT